MIIVITLLRIASVHHNKYFMTDHVFLFYIYDIHHTGPINVHKDSLLVGNCKIDIDATDYYAQISDKYNELLPNFLKKQNFHQFVPLKNPSMEMINGVVSICYYHNLVSYNIIYSMFPEYICYPKPNVEQELNNLYYAHGLDGWYDPRSNPISEQLDEVVDENGNGNV